MNSKQRSEQIFGGVFLIGFAILFIVQNFWWPGIMFVVGIAMMARTISEGKAWSTDHTALIVLGIAVFLALPWGGNWFPLLLIAIGVYMLFGDRLGLRPESKRRDDFDFPKRSEDKPKNDML